MIFSAGLAGCSADHSPPSTPEIAGTYMGRYGGGVETFGINADGTFSQVFQIGTNVIYRSSGKWEVTRQDMTFRPFVSPRAVTRRDSDTKVEVAPGGWARDPIRIDFGPWPYGVAKVSGQGATTPRPPMN
jgi:hypothetical protein